MINLKNINNVWFISDIHFGIRSNNLDWIEIHKEYFNQFLIPLLKKEKKENDILFILGDIFDNRQSINVLTQNFAMEIISKLSEIIPIYSLIGNHDIYYKNTNEVNSVKILSPYITKIFEEPEIIQINNLKFGVVPWIENKSKESQIINEISNDGCSYLLSHTEIQNFKFNSFRNIDFGIDASTLPKNIKKIISGHIHIRQDSKNVLFVGSPLALNRGDIGNKKGIYRLDLSDEKFKFYENNISPVFIQIYYDEFKEMTLETFLKTIKNNFVDIKIPSEFASVFPVQRIVDLVIDKSRNIRFDIINNDLVKGVDFLSDDNINDKDFNILNLLKEYVIKMDYEKSMKKDIFRELKKLYTQVEVLNNEN